MKTYRVTMVIDNNGSRATYEVQATCYSAAWEAAMSEHYGLVVAIEEVSC